MSSSLEYEKENPIGDYLLNKEIGSGGFAKVYEAIHIPTGEKVAVKIMKKEQIFSEPININRIQREIAILKIVRHNNIIKLYELMETPEKIYIVMEYCNGGELFDYIVSKQHLTEKQACRFFQEIINCLEYLHSINIVHRDIKPENLLLYKINNKINLKLIDFGISNCYSLDKLLNTPCGTASYAPPEMHKGEEYYGLLSDIWSAGVVLYAMVFGYLPFCEDDEDININNIIEGNYEIPEEASPELYDLLIHLLDINPLTRYDLEQIKEHPWFNLIKNYKYIPGIIEGYNKIPIDMNIVDLCEKYGYDKNKIIENVQKCNYNRNSAVYYIILSKMIREGYHSISDLYSDEFLNYINNPKNLINDYNNNKENNDKNKEKNNKKYTKNNYDKKENEKTERTKSNRTNRTNRSINKKNKNSFSKSQKKERREKPKEKNINTNKNKKEKLINIKYKNEIIKTEMINNNKNIYKKIEPLYSFHVISKTKEILNSMNDNKEINIDYINTSFNKKLSDDIKENILKLKNPKKNISKKEKEKKINNALLSLKMKKKKKKKQNKNNNKIKLRLKENNNNIFKEKEHTIIHNRNASLLIENKNIKNKNINIETNEYSISPNIKSRPESTERKNIINIYVHNKNSINNNNIYNINLITKNNYSINNNNKSNIKVKKTKINNLKQKQRKIPINNYEYLNTTNISNISINNRNIKYNNYQSPNKSQYIKLNNNIENKSKSQRNHKKEKNIITNNNNKYYHYKSRSLMDIDNPNNINNIYKEKDNYTITGNNKLENNFSFKLSSARNINNNKNTSRNNYHSIKQRKKLLNISFLNLPTYNSNKGKKIEPKIYKGPIDLKCLLYTLNINTLIEKISNILKKNKMNVIYINNHKLRCTQNGLSYDLEFFKLINNNNNSDNNSYINENEYNLKTISGCNNYKNNNKNNINNIYYYTITSKICKNKKLMKIISKIIYSKFNFFNNKNFI